MKQILTKENALETLKKLKTIPCWNNAENKPFFRKAKGGLHSFKRQKKLVHIKALIETLGLKTKKDVERIKRELKYRS